MKKLLVLGIGMFLLTGCGQGEVNEPSKETTNTSTTQEKAEKTLSHEEVATLLLDGMIYQRNQEEFGKVFKDSEDLLLPTDEDGNLSSEIVSGMMESSGANEEEAQAVSDAMVKSMIENASYTISEITPKGKGFVATYSIQGVDFVKAMELSSRSALDQLLQDLSGDLDEAKMESMIMSSMPQTLQEAGKVATPCEVKLTFTPSGKKWLIPETEEAAIEELALAFMLGYPSQAELDSHTEATMSALLAEYTALYGG